VTEIIRRPSLARALIGISERLRFQNIIRTGRTQMENDPWHGVPTFSAAWTRVAPPFLQYRMTPDGWITFRGYAWADSLPAQPSRIFTLPPEWSAYELEWHSTHGSFQVKGADEGTPLGAVLSFETDGKVFLHAVDNDTPPSGGVYYLRFDGIKVWAGP
jgi:hypothetical protein